ncbi:hypothetical protein OFN97_02705 [Campylobacter sp. VBCF_05 NA6]|uniref:hypothetical protein n=1 Tax=unclassified Campylobacter TaxID=2593542 RepID=UPI0022E9A33E|nr:MULTISPECIES: hypothetical protein [unclassified Campylobacter]MDA3057502.1 hypothetical protein [Campylobacter sp. VBCF_04 NA7]MDA3058926.1 hypothetical protein [Campylobacter sp. VBCF_05 NA6]MDA3062217.1 hypothetical protein [Campylobacter sp. JMF_14 EL1]MDA3073664.1 hypothetical protein [Campylobacter sp. JMF_10 EL2]
MKKLIFSILFTNLFFSFAFGQDICDEQYMREWIDRLDSMALNAGKKDFWFSKSECQNNTIILNTHINTNQTPSQREKDELDKFMKNEVMCSDYNIELAADIGLNIKMNFFNKSGNLVHTINTNPRNCPNFLNSTNICDRKYIINSINKFNARMPMVLDEYSATYNLYCASNTYIYSTMFFVNHLSDNTVLELKNEYQQIMLNSYCTNPSDRLLRKLGVSVKHDYYLQNGTFLFSTHASPSNCPNF